MSGCEVVIGSFVFGPAFCGKVGVGQTTICEEWPDCRRAHTVCAEHSSPTERVPAPRSEVSAKGDS